MWTFHKLFSFLFPAVFVQAAYGGEILLVSHNFGILLVDVENKTNTSVLSADRPVVAFDVHWAWRHLFWATESTIYRTPLYDLATTTPLAEVERVGSLAVDWVHHHLYWTDQGSGGGRVEAAHLDGRRRRVVHHLSGGSNIGAMVLDPLLGKLFWIEWDHEKDNRTRIMFSNLDGSSKRTFYKSELIPKNSPLAVDVTYNGIYFHKVTRNVIELWGNSYKMPVRAKLFDSPGEPASSLCSAKVGFYFSNKTGTYASKWVNNKYTIVYGDKTDHIFSLEPFFRLIDSKLTTSSQIRVVSEVTQPQWPDECSYHQCEHECVVTSHQQESHHHQQESHQRNTLCVCRYGYALREDGRTCEERGYLIYSSGTTFGRITTKGVDNTLLYNDFSANIQTFDVDVDLGYLYWSDLFAQTIYRAPIEQLPRKEVVVAGVSAFGLTLDWLHGNVYWTDHSRVLVVPVHGGRGPVVVLDELASAANMAVDPIDKYIFLVECGVMLTIKRAGLDGSDVTNLTSFDVTCGMSLTADHATRTLFVLDCSGTVILYRYDGTGGIKLFSDVVRGVAIVDHQPLWAVIEYADAPEDTYAFFRDQLNVLAHDLQPSLIKGVKKSHQPAGTNVCAEVECGGVCLPTSKSEAAECVYPRNDNKMTTCPNMTKKVKGRSPNDYLAVVEMTPFSVTLQCTRPLMKHNIMRPWVRVDEVDSLVPREAGNRRSRHVHIDNRSLPFTVDGLNPATTYHFTVQHGVTIRGSHTIELHTPPPPLGLRRLPIVIVPGIPGGVSWEPQGVHFGTVNSWEHLLYRKYYLLLLTSTTHSQVDPPHVPEVILDLLSYQIKSSFIVLTTYMSEEEFDDNPEMYLEHLLWGAKFQLAMVKSTEYKGSYNLDIVYSTSFALPGPY